MYHIMYQIKYTKSDLQKILHHVGVSNKTIKLKKDKLLDLCASVDLADDAGVDLNNPSKYLLQRKKPRQEGFGRTSVGSIEMNRIGIVW